MKWLVSKRKQSLKQRNLRPKTETVHNQKFDEATGQIYTEKTASIQSSDDRDWPWQTPMVAMSDIRDSVDYYEYLKAWEMGRSVENLGGYQSYLDALKNFRVIGFKGARTLQNSAIECILKNIEDITFEVIECLPRHIVRRVWRAVNQRSVIFSICFTQMYHIQPFSLISGLGNNIPTVDACHRSIHGRSFRKSSMRVTRQH